MKKIYIKENKNWIEKFAQKTKIYKETDVSKWTDEMYSNFILGKDIGSVGQSYFQGDGKENVMNWLRKNKELIREIRNIEGAIDCRIEIYKKFQKGVLNVGKRNCWMTVHAMIVALQPKFLCNILSEDRLDRLYELLENLSSEHDEDNSEKNEKGQNKVNDSSRSEITLIFKTENSLWKTLQEEWKTATEKDISISWYYKSAAIYNYFNNGGVRGTVNSDTPWQVYVALNGDERVKMIAKRLELQKNIILTGAPGTGKTYLAHRIAAEMIGCKVNTLKSNDNKQFELVQFHPSYDYTDFVEGLRPITKDKQGTIVFERKDGIFKAFCAEAATAEKEDIKKEESEKRKFVFIIDEINRGEIAKIFGELFFSIDPGYRGNADKDGNSNRVKTQYQNLVPQNDIFYEGFYVPNNVYVIGTMNDIDRSVESMDFAFRRRFAFIEISAEDSEIIINNSDIDEGKQQELITKMENLNNAIIDPEKGGLSSEYQIGGAYFLKYKDVQKNYNRLWDEYLKGVLLEYYRGNPQQKEILKKLKEAYDSKEDSKKKGKAELPTPQS